MTPYSSARIVVSEFMDGTAVARLAEAHEMFYDEGLVDRPGELRARVATADALIVRNRTQVDADLLAQAPALKVVGRLGVGLDNIDMEACAARGIDVIPATGANALAVAEYVICTAMMFTPRRLCVIGVGRRGQWPRASLLAEELSGRWALSDSATSGA
jgi:(S)-sulfolactate dehydrogenase